MLKEMPKKYWKNMPEAALIPELVAGAQNREAQMVDKGKSLFADGLEDRPDTLAAIDKAIHACRNAEIGQLDNHAVMGEGPDDAVLMIVGEQPGDEEDLAGRPFVGPAGQLLDVHLEKAGIDRRSAYVTNTVKHFKYVQRGKQRLHQNPRREGNRHLPLVDRKRTRDRAAETGAGHGRQCGARDAGQDGQHHAARGRPIPLEDGSELWVTAHPSYLLRLDGPAREEQARLFDADLAAVRARLAELRAMMPSTSLVSPARRGSMPSGAGGWIPAFAGQRRLPVMPENDLQIPKRTIELDPASIAAPPRSPFVELGLVSCFSFLRGASDAVDLLLQARALGYDAIGIADANTMAGVVRIHTEAKTLKLKPLIGCRIETVEGLAFLAYPRDRAAYGLLPP